MASMAGSQPPMEVGQPSTNNTQSLNNNPTVNNTLDYSKILKLTSLNATMHVHYPTTNNIPHIPIKLITFLHRKTLVKWAEAEVNRMNIIEGLQYAVVGKFSYVWLELQELHRIIPLLCRIKGECNVGFFRDRHVLIRLTLLEDFINLTSKGAYYLKAKDGYQYQMRPLIYDSKYIVNKETPMALAWISFPNLLPIFFLKEYLFSLASAFAS